MSSTSASSTTSTNPTNTYSDLFPSASTSASAVGPVGGTGSNVYYLVFLGVLVVLLLMAACLAFRAFRMRRRYRTATQLAIARGEPPPNMRDDYWGLGRLSAWPPDGLDRFGMVPGMEGMYGRGERRIRKPEMWEAEVDGKAEWDQEWEDTQPLTVHSLRPPPTQIEDPDQSVSLTPNHMGPRPRPPPILSFSALAQRRRGSQTIPTAPDPPVRQERRREIDRELDLGEDVRVAVVIRMPREEERQRGEEDGEGENEVGWENGMELGVWEGLVGAEGVGGKRDHRARAVWTGGEADGG